MAKWPAKASTERRDHQIDWSAFLGDTDEIATSVVSATGVTVDSSAIDTGNRSVTIWLSGGTSGTIATVSNTITTDDGRTEAEVVTVEINDYGEPVTLAEAKAQLRILDDASEDDLIAAYIGAARDHVEKYTGTALITQTRTLKVPNFSALQSLSAAPLQSVTSITYLDTAGEEQALSTDVYEAVIDGLEASIRLKVGQSWPAVRPVSDAVRATVVCGYGDTGAEVPAPIRQAMLLLIGHWFATREAVNVGNIVTEMPMGVEALLCNHRRFG